MKKLEEKYVELHKREKGLLKDRETFISFMHLVFPQQILDEVIIHEDPSQNPEGDNQSFGLYDIEHLRQFWTLMRTQTDNESTHIIAVMREEKLMLMHKIQTYERQLTEHGDYETKLKDLETHMASLQSEIRALKDEKRQHE